MRRWILLLFFTMFAAANIALPTPTPTPRPGAMPFAGPPMELYALNVDNPCNPSPSPCTDLRWQRRVPTFGGPKWPTVVVIHGGRFKQGQPGPTDVAQDLATAGFMTLAIQYRLAPPHVEMNDPQPNPPGGDGQQDPPSGGHPSNQTDDVMTAIRAAFADPQCNGWVAVVGTSGGGYLVGWPLFAGRPKTDQPMAVVSLSGPFDLDNSDFLASGNLNDIQNYLAFPTGTVDPAMHAPARAASGYWLPVLYTPPPFLGFNSNHETIPLSELTNMTTLKLIPAGGYVESHVLNGSLHADSYWPQPYASPTVGVFPTVRDATINFLQNTLGSPTPSVTATATFTPTPSATPTGSPSATSTPTATPSATATATNTPTPTATISGSPTPTATADHTGRINVRMKQ